MTLGYSGRPRLVPTVARVTGRGRSDSPTRLINEATVRTRRRASILRVAIPAVLGVLIGGVLVFGYGLSFFMPMIELLKEISAPEGAY